MSLTLQVCLFVGSAGGLSSVHAYKCSAARLGLDSTDERGYGWRLTSVSLCSLFLSLPSIILKYFEQMIPPRGCAYIVMVHRQDAYRALQKLSRGNYKVNQKSIKVHFYHL